jgi:hypothetical protein
MTTYAKKKLKYSQNENFNLLHYVEWDRIVTLTGRTSIHFQSFMTFKRSLLSGCNKLMDITKRKTRSMIMKKDKFHSVEDLLKGGRCNCSCFEIDQEMDAILLIIGIVYRVCRIVIKSVQQCTYFLFSVNLLLVGINYRQRTMQVCS